MEHNRTKVTSLLGLRIKFKLTTSCEKRIVTESIHRENLIDRLVLALQISDPLSPSSTKLRNKQTNFILRIQALFVNYPCNLFFKFLYGAIVFSVRLQSRLLHAKKCIQWLLLHKYYRSWEPWGTDSQSGNFRCCHDSLLIITLIRELY